MSERRWLVVDVLPQPTNLGIRAQVVMGTAALLPCYKLMVTVAGGGSFALQVNRRNTEVVAKLVLRTLARHEGEQWHGRI